jgi:hypothetical protein
VTRTAWRDKRDEIERLTPGVQEGAFVFTYARQQYEREFGLRCRSRSHREQERSGGTSKKFVRTSRS